MPHPPRNTRSFRTRWTRFPFLLTRDLLDELDQVGRAFLAGHGIHDEPVFWQPPADLLDGLDLPRADPAHLDIADLHQRVSAGQTPLPISQALGTDLRTLRYVLIEHPRPAPELSAETTRALSTGSASLGMPIARKLIPKDRLRRLYVEQNRTFVDIARETGLNRKTLAALADEYGIPRHPYRPHGVNSRDWLHEQYVERNRCFSDLAYEVGVCPGTMARWAREYEIPRQSNRHLSRPALDLSQAPAVLQPTLTDTYRMRRLNTFLKIVAYPTLTEACRALSLSPATVTLRSSAWKRISTAPC